MIIYHPESRVPVLPTAIDLDDEEWVYMVWDSELSGGESISSSFWFIDVGIVGIDSTQNVGVEDITRCNSFSKSNGIKLSPQSLGTFKVENQIVTSKNRTISRAFKITVRYL